MKQVNIPQGQGLNAKAVGYLVRSLEMQCANKKGSQIANINGEGPKQVVQDQKRRTKKAKKENPKKSQERQVGKTFS